MDATRLREFFETLWPDAPYSFGTYDRRSVKSDERYLSEEESSTTRRRKRRGEKRLAVVVNVSSPGDENAAESDGEGMVNAAETLLELGVPFVVLTLWQDNALARGLKSGNPAEPNKTGSASAWRNARAFSSDEASNEKRRARRCARRTNARNARRKGRGTSRWRRRWPRRETSARTRVKATRCFARFARTLAPPRRMRSPPRYKPRVCRCPWTSRASARIYNARGTS